MKVILTQDVAKVGLRHDIVEVPNGYALNKLIPKQLAMPATPENQRQMKQALERRAAANSAMAKSYEAAVSELANKTVSVSVEANEKGHLFEALKPERVAEAIKAEGVEITADVVLIEEPIKEIGEHTIMLTDGTDKQPLSILVEKA